MMSFPLFKSDDAAWHGEYPTAGDGRGVVLMTKAEAAEPDALERAERRLRAFRGALKAHPRLGKALKDKDDEREGDERESDEMTNDERRRRGVAAKGATMKESIFKSVVFGDMHDVKEFPIEEQPSRQPRGADDGDDALGRAYSDAVLERLGGGNVSGTRMSPVPDAGSGPTWEGTTEDVTYRPQVFTRNQDDGYVGGEERTYRPVGPNRGNAEAYELLRENLEPSAIPVRLGDGWVMNPAASGLPEVSSFKAPEPATSVRKAGTGLFNDAIFGAHGDLADGFLG